MTKEELKKEAEEYAEQFYGWCNNDQVTDVAIATYITSAEPREKRIAELEDKLANADYQLEGRDIKIKELEKENAELKSDNDARRFAMAMSAKVEKQLRKENAELKELIKNIIRVTWGEGWNYSLDWKVKAEQFINSEVEK